MLVNTKIDCMKNQFVINKQKNLKKQQQEINGGGEYFSKNISIAWISIHFTFRLQITSN